MPIIQIHVPLYDKLPPELYGGVFRLWMEPLEAWTGATERAWGYLFQDGQWHAHGRDILSWSRQILACVDPSTFWQPTTARPEWLCGHGFQLRGDVDRPYLISGSATTVPLGQMIVWAKEAIGAMQEADFYLDSWGGTEDRHFHSAMQKHMTEGAHAQHEILQMHVETRGALDAFIRHQNSSNRVSHPAYIPKGPRNASGISQTEAGILLTGRFQNASISAGPATIYANLFSVTPSDTALGTLAAYTNYAGQSVTCNSSNFAVSAGATTYSGGIIAFPTCGASGETEVAVAWTTVASPGAGNQIIEWGTFASQAISNGNTPQFNNSTLTTSAV